MFKSKYTNGTKNLTSAQWLSEIMCERLAEIEGRSLVARFWEKEDWKKRWLAQCVMANRLLKIYSVWAIAAALKTEKGQRIYSLGAKFLVPIIIQEAERLVNRATQDTHPLPVYDNVAEPQRPDYNNSDSVRSKLREL